MLTTIEEIITVITDGNGLAFEYDPDGPNPTNQKLRLKLEPGKFDEKTASIVSTSGKLKVAFKNLTRRSGAYFLVDDAGTAWKPAGEGMRRVLGNITNDREQVLAALRQHIAELV